jgi:hypothetical protein
VVANCVIAANFTTTSTSLEECTVCFISTSYHSASELASCSTAGHPALFVLLLNSHCSNAGVSAHTVSVNLFGSPLFQAYRPSCSQGNLSCLIHLGCHPNHRVPYLVDQVR